MNSIDQQNVAPQTSFDLSETISIWLREFEVSLSKCDPAAVAALFEEDGNWRDVLAFTWHLTPVVGAAAIAETMVGRQQADLRRHTPAPCPGDQRHPRCDSVRA